ncbi:30S ribosomal protein S25e [Fervidicoccus fontis]|jgi:ribosomal protein S25|nr:30S ribosomal protein S25e [Fervidicoccus fontis]MBE9391303.1 30S ribosomal protein S25e [Fervidicoccus fontis]PMB75567.1 MAG: 30S ribosomal protein S25e [Fervidicoccus fontis]PMB78415.1 MAG: 30S ribosomal protein S25e [Fervidicoccus fontis]HEW64354.1 30S ribosomal protein S25e [Fervidicoccus fontis]
MPKKREGGEEKPKARTMTEQAEMNVSVPDELLKRAERELKQVEYITPFMLSQKLSVSISTSKKILKMLAEKGTLKTIVQNRRAPIYVPADKV